MLTLTPTSRAPTAPTLAEVLAAVRAADLPLRRRQEMIAALNTTARVLGRDLAQIPANPPLLRRRLAEANPLAHNLTQARWANVRSLLRAALSLIQPVSASRASTPLLPAWQALQARLDHAAIDRRRQAELLRLMRFCSDRQVLPEAVDDAVFAAFQAFLDNGLRKTAEDTFVTVCRFWNRLAATLPGWPAFQVARISRRQVWTLPWSAFPASLQAEVQAWLDRSAGTDPLGELPIRPARPATLRWHRSGLRIAASALVQRGRDPASLTGLADLVELTAFKEICRYLLSRQGEGGASSYVAMVAALLRAVARHWVGAPSATLEAMAAIVARLTPPRRGLGVRNRDRLRPFDERANAQALIRLPARLMQEAAGKLPAQRAALLAQMAVAIELLLMAPLRISNLAALDLARNLVRLPHSRRAALVIEGEGVKNGEPLDYPLPEDSIRLLDTYLQHHRPVLASAGSTALFPGRGTRCKNPMCLSRQITRTVRRYTGLTMHAHLFRHLAAKLYLDAHPGAYEVVRRVLGHRSMDTTTGFYTGLETAAAVRHFDATILRLRQKGAGV